MNEDKNEYLGVVKDMAGQPDPVPSVRDSLVQVAGQNPDYEAELVKISQRTGVPLETARNVPDLVKQRDYVDGIQPDLLQAQYPKVAEFLSNPVNASVSHDDIGILRRVSNTFNMFSQGTSRGAVQERIAPLHYRALTGEITPFEEIQRQKLKTTMGMYGRQAAQQEGVDYLFEQTGYAARQLFTSLKAGGQGAVVGAGVGAGAAAVAGQLGPQIALPEEIVTVPAAAAFGARTGFVASSVVHNYQQEAGFAFDEFSDFRDAKTKQPLDKETARGAAAAVGLINAGLETVADLTMIKFLPGVGDLLAKQGGKKVVEKLLDRPSFRKEIARVGMKWLKVGTTEGITEGLQEVTAIIGGELAKNVDGGEFESDSFEEMRSRVWESSRDAFTGAMGVGSAGAGYQGYRGAQRVRAAEQNQAFMEALGKDAADSKLRQRLPEKFHEFIAKAKEGGPVENVYIPAEQFQRYFQSAGVNPSEVAAEVGAKNYDEALATGSDVMISLEDYATFLAPTEHHALLMQDTRLHIGDMTPRELQQFNADREARMAELSQQLMQEEAAPSTEYQTIHNEIMGELANRFDANTAQGYATLYAKGITTIAERAGIPAIELHQRYGLSVNSGLPQVLEQLGTSDVGIDPLLDRLRSGDIPTELQAYGASLAEFVRENGGIADQGGDLLSMDADTGNRPFQKNLIQKNGRTYDAMRQLAAEAGYLDDGSTVSQFLDMLDQDLNDAPVYSMSGGDPVAQNMRNTLESLDRALTESGIDLNAMTNDQVRQALQGATQLVEDIAQRYDQDAEAQQQNIPEFLTRIADLVRGKGYEAAKRAVVAQVGSVNRGEKFDDDVADSVFLRLQRVAQVGRYTDESDLAYRNARRLDGDGDIEIYRAAPKGGGIRPGDFAAATKNEAGFYTHGKNIVQKFTVPRRDVIAVDGSSGGGQEYVYLPSGYEAETPIEHFPSFKDFFDAVNASTNRFNQSQPVHDETGLPLNQDVAKRYNQSAPVESEAFRAWFGDSKVVDADGNPLVVYHGSPDVRGILKDGFQARRTRGSVFFAAKDYAVANSYADDRRAFDYQNAEANTIPLYLSMKNPMIIDAGGKHWKETERFVEEAKDAGHDGIIINNSIDYYNNQPNSKPTTVYAWFEPTQAKSAMEGNLRSRVDGIDIGGGPNVGTYDPNNPSILFQSGAVHEETGLPLNKDGTVTLYHHTSKEKAEQIRKTGRLKSAGEPDVYLTTQRDTDTGYGDTAVAVNVDPDSIIIDDEFPGGRVDYRMNVGRPGGSVSVSFPQDQFNQDTGAPRGFITFGQNRKATITLLEKADLSTFLHESGHFWLEVMGELATDSLVAPQIAEDYATILKWFGVESREQIGVEQHEKFARGFEAYLMEGRAPSPELRQIFQRFKAWLSLIYKRLANLDVTLNQEIRSVFDRILATDEEIAAARSDSAMTELFATAADAGMTESEFNAYRKHVEKASESAKDILQKKLMTEYQRAEKKWWKDQEANVRAEVEAEVDADQTYQAFNSLTTGELPDGTAIKISKQDLVERYGAEYVKKLPRSKQAVYTSDESKGWPTDLVAETMGFAGPDQMVEALVNMRPRKELVRAETTRRMRERHGDLIADGTIADEAMAAVHNEERANVITAEIRALNRKRREVEPVLAALRRTEAEERTAGMEIVDSVVPTKPVEVRRKDGSTYTAQMPDMAAYRDMARGMIGQKNLRDIDPNTYLAAERRSARAAMEAVSRKDYMVAASHKQKELLNHYMYREALTAIEDGESIQKYAKNLTKPAAQSRIGKAGADYLEQINEFLERYEFKKVSAVKRDRRSSLLAWYNGQIALGFNPAIPPELLEDADQHNYLDTSIDELRSVRDAMRSIEHLARLKNTLSGKQDKIEFDAAVDELIAAAVENTRAVELPSIDVALKTRKQKAGDWMRSWDADLLPVETVIDWMDGQRADGPWHRYIFNRASEAQSAELDMIGRIGKLVGDLLDEFHMNDRTYLLDKFTFDEVGTVSKHWLLSVAMNVGNQSNYDKMLRGHNWTAAQVDRMLSKLNKSDWQFVQGMWDAVNEMWSEIEALETRISGVAPEKIVARPYMIRDEAGNVIDQVKGGYFPLAYDPKFSKAGLQQETGTLAGLLEQGYAAATTPKGHTQARTGFAAPLLLDFGNVVQKHLSGVVKDLTHREFLIDANRLFNDSRIRKTLQDQLGAEYERMFMPWLRAIANDRNVSPTDGLSSLDRIIETARTNTTTVALGYKVTTIVAQIAGVANAIEIVGPGWFANGLQQSTRSPRESYAMVVEKSGEMRHRFETIDRDVRDELRTMRDGKTAKWHAAVNRGAFVGINIADRMVTIPTWIGAYNKARVSGMAEAEAIHQADGAVRRSQGAGGAKDLNAIQRKRGAIKMLTMFFTPFAAQYGRLRTAKQRMGVEGARYAPEAIMRVLMITALPAVMSDLLTNRGPKECSFDDPECYARWVAVKSAFSITATIPLLRDIGNLAEKQLSEDKPGSRDMRISPVISMIDGLSKTFMKSMDVAFGEREADEDFWFNWMESAGYVINLPTGQARITMEYFYDLLAGNAEPENAGDFMRDAAFRRSKEEKQR